MIESMLGIEAVARGNEVSMSGEEASVHRARMALEHLYSRLEAGEIIEKGDVTGAVRMAIAEDQLSLPSMGEKTGRLSMAQIGTRRKVIQARTRTQDKYIRAMDGNELIFGVGPAGTGKT
ncbi:MAG: PhoH family protein, partial [Nitratireductor sp.]|nr:PhoH family protein [Nitratireductor sp.]